jgi:hypothetical protein
MIPFLAPLMGSLAGSLLPASIGTSIAGAVGASGAMGGLIASAAPKALGAGIGTLLAGGDSSEALLNAAGFGAGGALLQQGLGAAPQGAAVASLSTLPETLTQAGRLLQNQGPGPQPVAPSVVQSPQTEQLGSMRPPPRPVSVPGEGGLQGSVLGGPPQTVGSQALSQIPSGAPVTSPQGGLGSFPEYVDPSMIAQAASPQNPMAAQQMFQNRGMIA